MGGGGGGTSESSSGNSMYDIEADPVFLDTDL